MSQLVKRATRVVAVAVVAAAVAATAAVAYAQRTTELLYTGPSKGKTSVATPVTIPYPTRWEYGRFRYSPLQTDWSWRSGGERVQGDAATIWRKLDGPQRPTAGEIWYGEVVSVLGHQGWEVLVMRDYEGGSEVWFRRPAR